MGLIYYVMSKKKSSKTYICYKGNKYAFVTLVMLSDSYIPGALVLGYSLKLVSKIDRICMVTNHVSKKAINQLKKLFIVKKIPELKFKSKPMRTGTKEQKERYDSWIDSSYSKWYCLNFTEYDKIIFLDADTIVTKNIDNIFAIDSPAGVFMNPWTNKYNKKSNIQEMYDKIKIGSKIPLKTMQKAIDKRGALVTGSGVLLSPNKNHYKKLIKLIKTNLPFGLENSANGYDEQSITLLYHNMDCKWTYLPYSFNSVPWYLWLIFDNDKKIISKKSTVQILSKKIPLIIHYFGSESVWNMNPLEENKYSDINLWWTLVYNFILENNKKNRNILKKIFKINYKIPKTDKERKFLKKCYICEYLKINSNHFIINSKNEIKCPILKKNN